MPELPEVETIVKGLRKKVRNRKIIKIWTDWPKYFKLPKLQKEFERHVVGKKIIAVERKGKNVIFTLSDNHILLIHQKLSGHLLVGAWHQRKSDEQLLEKWQKEKWIPDAKTGAYWDDRNRFIRLVFYLDNKQMLVLSDLRRFAKVLCGPKEIILALPDLIDLGPDALNLSQKEFLNLFKNKKGVIKQLLLDQNFIAGIGNIYADEVLWFSKIHPKTRAENLKKSDLKILYNAIRKILQKALKLGGSSIDDYRTVEGKLGTYHLTRYVYQREGEPCYRCGAKIARIKIGSRSAHFCPKCQKELKSVK